MHNKRRQNNMNGGGGGPHRHHNNRPRRFSNNRPQGGSSDDPANVSRTRRNATQNREKYQMMARDAQASGDRVLAEYYLQHADHYHRVILALPPEEAPRPQYLQRHEQGQGDPQGAHHPQDGNVSGGSEQDQMPPSAHGLPPFITQPGAEGQGE
jgi:hypothetical protein